MDYRSALEGKIQAGDLNFGKKSALWSRSFETVVSSLDFVYRKLQQTPEIPPNRLNKQQKPGKLSIFCYFIQKGKHFSS